jgi:hypothetical protein
MVLLIVDALVNDKPAVYQRYFDADQAKKINGLIDDRWHDRDMVRAELLANEALHAITHPAPPVPRPDHGIMFTRIPANKPPLVHTVDNFLNPATIATIFGGAKWAYGLATSKEAASMWKKAKPWLEGAADVASRAYDYVIRNRTARVRSFSRANGESGIEYTHKEYVTDIQAVADPTIMTLEVNPGLSKSFPYLAEKVDGFDKYRFKKLNFIFRTATNTITSGTVAMGIDFDARDAPLTELEQIMNTQNALESAIYEDIVYKVPLELSNVTTTKLIRTDFVGAEAAELYDTGKLYVRTKSTPDAVGGHLYAEYVVEFLSPTIGDKLPQTGAIMLVKNMYDFIVAAGTDQTTNQPFLDNSHGPAILLTEPKFGFKYDAGMGRITLDAGVYRLRFAGSIRQNTSSSIDGTMRIVLVTLPPAAGHVHDPNNVLRSSTYPRPTSTEWRDMSHYQRLQLASNTTSGMSDIVNFDCTMDLPVYDDPDRNGVDYSHYCSSAHGFLPLVIVRTDVGIAVVEMNYVTLNITRL